MISPILRATFLSVFFVAQPVGAGSHDTVFFTKSQICQSIIATVIDRGPETMQTDKVSGDIVHITYTSSDDGRQWHYSCKLQEPHAFWISEGEDWSEAEGNSKVTYSTLRDKLYIVEKFRDGSFNSRSFKLGQYGI